MDRDVLAAANLNVRSMRRRQARISSPLAGEMSAQDTRRGGFLPPGRPGSITALLAFPSLPPPRRASAAFPTTRTDLTPKDLARVQAITKPATDFSKPEPFELMQGGAATTKKRPNQDAFSQSSANITFEEEGTFKLGNGLFRKVWVSSPSSTQASDGLGPLFNARACQSCHLKDGRGHPPEGDADATSMFLRLARAADTDEEKQAVADANTLNFPDPVYGAQLQDLAVPGLSGEGRMTITYTEMPVTLGDGTVVSLRKPTYSVTDPGLRSARPANDAVAAHHAAMIGLGLVEQIHPADLWPRPTRTIATATASPANQYRRDCQGTRRSAASAGKHRRHRSASRPPTPSPAISVFRRRKCLDTMATAPRRRRMPGHADRCAAAAGKSEAPPPVMDLVTFYSQNLAVPARRDIGKAEFLAGKKAFYDTGCASCHTPKFVTRRDAPDKALAFQLIWPYSDFLLHDMGEGLADGQQVGDATGSEWRTPPLWGIGLTKRVSGHTFFLHDGRARNLTEAILGMAARRKRRATVLQPCRRRSRDADQVSGVAVMGDLPSEIEPDPCDLRYPHP